jgi:hypothetical protein
MHGDDGPIVPYADSGPLSAKLVQNGTLKTYQGFPHGMPTTQAETINPDLLAFLQARASGGAADDGPHRLTGTLPTRSGRLETRSARDHRATTSASLQAPARGMRGNRIWHLILAGMRPGAPVDGRSAVKGRR